MGLVVVGLSHKTAPIELREHLAVPSQKMESVLKKLKSFPDLTEVVVLSTCNRLELYARPENARHPALNALHQFFNELYPHPHLRNYLYQYEAHEAVRHLFRVVSGLDSLVVGETEILGQVKSAYRIAQDQGTTGKITNVLFQRALFIGKQIRANTSISDGASSVGNITVQLAERIFGNLQECRLMLIGAGEIAEVTARHLLSQKTKQLVILNRTVSKAVDLATLLNGVGLPLENLQDELGKADIVIASASVEEPLVTKKLVNEIMKIRHERPLYFIDIAVPRNIDPSVHEIDNVYVYNIDDLKSLVDENIKKRSAAIGEAEAIVNKTARESYEWISKTLDGQRVAHRHQIEL